MIKISELPIFILMMFTLLYACVGNPDNEVWSGLYFFVNYLTIFLLSKNSRSKLTRIIGMALSVSILIFIVLKYFFTTELLRLFTIIPFAICLYGFYKIEKRCTN